MLSIYNHKRNKKVNTNRWYHSAIIQYKSKKGNKAKTKRGLNEKNKWKKQKSNNNFLKRHKNGWTIIHNDVDEMKKQWWMEARKNVCVAV